MKIKFYILIPVLLFAVLFQKSYAQRIKGAVIVGANISQVDGDEIFGFNKVGFNVGAAAIIPFAENFSFSIETIFNQKGSYQGKQYRDTDSLGNILTGEYKLKLDYLEVPFMIHYTDKDIITAGVGFSYGRLVNVKEWEHGRLIETTTLNTGPYDRTDFNILADIRFRIYKRFKFNIRYAYSLAKIRTRDFYDIFGDYVNTRKQYNNLITFRLIYVFNEKSRVVDH
ncbi:MAG: PorT family protein [Bacteroidales bacterium]|nr:PorT family protein [Bacteroidales bacterium]